MNAPASRTCVACSIFRREIEALGPASLPDTEVRYLGSMLHIVPEALERRLRSVLREEKARGRNVALAFGDCCAHMLEFQGEEGVARTEGINCCEILLGRDRYRALRRDGVFFWLPEWAGRWRAIFEEELGLTEANARDLMRDMHTRMVYLDTGLVPVPRATLDAASAFTGLPWETLPVDLGAFAASLGAALARADSHG